jgi:hypothetical protein
MDAKKSKRENRMATQTQPTTTAGTVPVTADNFIRAESDLMISGTVKSGGLGKFIHFREPMAIDCPIIRPNRDTLYSFAEFDLEAGPVTVTLPDPGKRFQTMIVIDQDHYVPQVIYTAGTFKFSKESIGGTTRYLTLGMRILVNPDDPADVAEVHKLQDAIKVEQPGGPGVFEIPNWDQASQKKVRDALLALNETLPDLKDAFGSREEVDPVRHLIGTASAYGGNPDKDAVYLNIMPKNNDGTVIYKLTVKNDVPVDGFWSISVYDAEGHFRKNDLNAYTLNNITAKKDADGSVTVQFGGCDGKVANCLPICPGWNYMVRLYRPRKEVLDGTWKFPEAEAAS